MLGAAAAVDSHCEAVSQEADRHSGARSAGAHSCNTGNDLVFCDDLTPSVL